MSESNQGVVGETPRVSGIAKLNRVNRYLEREAHRDVNRKLPVGESVRIPTGRFFGSMRYTHEGERVDWTNRDIWAYRGAAFGDQFETIGPSIRSLDTSRLLVRETTNSLPVPNTSEHDLFAPGKRVLFPGSGQAIAPIQYAKLYPEAVIIGIDRGYNKSKTIDVTKTGVQLTRDDWTELKNIPDHSIDSIVSVQDAFRWGVQPNNMEDSLKIVEALTRVAKMGAVLRFDILSPQSLDALHAKRLLDAKGWDVTFTRGTAIAVRTRDVSSEEPAPK